MACSAKRSRCLFVITRFATDMSNHLRSHQVLQLCRSVTGCPICDIRQGRRDGTCVCLSSRQQRLDGCSRSFHGCPAVRASLSLSAHLWLSEDALPPYSAASFGGRIDDSQSPRAFAVAFLLLVPDPRPFCSSVGLRGVFVVRQKIAAFFQLAAPCIRSLLTEGTNHCFEDVSANSPLTTSSFFGALEHEDASR